MANYNAATIQITGLIRIGAISLLLLVAGCAQGVPGDQTKFDPIASFGDVQKAVGNDVQIESMTIDYVKADGTLDMTASYKPEVFYTFGRQLDSPPPSAPPVGVSGVTSDKWYAVKDVFIEKDKMLISDNNKQHLILTDPPKCAMSTLWAVALEKGATKDAVATVYYDASGYRFTISALKVNLNFGMDCRLKAN